MISSIKICNFKSIIESKAKLPLFGAIVGLNAAGKSNLIYSIEIARSLMRGANLSQSTAKYGSVNEELFNLRDVTQKKPFSFEFELDVESGFKYIFGISISLKKNQNALSSLIVDQEFLKKNINGNEIVVYNRYSDGTVKIPNESIPSTISAEEDVLFINLYKTPDTEKVKQIFQKTRIVSSDINMLRTPALFMKGSDVARADHISNLIGRLMKDPNLYSQFVKIIKKMMPNLSEFREIKIDDETVKNKEFMVLMQEITLQGELSTRSFSEGDLRTIAIIATGLDMSEDASFFIEEIENGMHAGRAEKLVEYLDTFSKVKNIQIMFTTHSPLIINDMKPQDVLFVSKNGHGTTFELLGDSEDVTTIKLLLKEGGNLTDYLSAKLHKH